MPDYPGMTFSQQELQNLLSSWQPLPQAPPAAELPFPMPARDGGGAAPVGSVPYPLSTRPSRPARPAGKEVTPFISKLYKYAIPTETYTRSMLICSISMLSDQTLDGQIKWCEGGKSFTGMYVCHAASGCQSHYLSSAGHGNP